MIRKESEDISDDIFEKVIKPFNESMHNHISKNIINEYVAFYIASSYEMDALYENSIINVFGEAVESLRQVSNMDFDTAIIKELLKEKYNLEIKKEIPLEIKELECNV